MYTGERPTLLANCIVNGVANFKVVMRDTDDFAATDDLPVDESIITQPRHKFNGRLELRFMFVTSTAVKNVKGFKPAHRGGRIVVDGSIVHSLGPLQREAAVQSAILLDDCPKTIRFEVFTADTPVLHPSEVLLVEHTLALLESDEYGGSISCSHLQNQVRELPFYPVVFERARSSWLEFTQSHTDKWTAFRYTPEEIEMNQISTTCRTKELRVYANKHEHCYRVGDIARERVRARAEAELQDVLLERLRERPYEQSELLKELVNERSFLTLITPNIIKILGMYEAHPDEYFVLCDALHPIAIEPKRHCLDEPGPRNGLQYDRIRRQMIPKTETPKHRVGTSKPATPASSTYARSEDSGDRGDHGDHSDNDGAAKP
jgi:hypothetical protein